MFVSRRLTSLLNKSKYQLSAFPFRTFLSPAYYCNEVWEQRFTDPLLKKVDLDLFYNELDQKYQKIKNISAVDVDIFANAVKNRTHFDELLDIIHKLRLSAETCYTLESTHHAVLKNLLNEKEYDLLHQILDDRLNYGIFLDYYMANLLLDTFWKEKKFVSGAHVASQLMLQEDFTHPLNIAFSLLHCFNYLLDPKEWHQVPTPKEPEDEKKVRVKYLRNPYDDDHFDLKDPLKIVGKTLVLATKSLNDMAEKSLHAAGLALWEKPEKLKLFVKNINSSNEKIFEEAFNLIPDSNESKRILLEVPKESGNLQELLQDRVKKAEHLTSEKDIVAQCESYTRWIKDRRNRLEEQNLKYLKTKRLKNIEETLKSLKEKEKLLWFFENQDNIELQIEENQAISESISKSSRKKEANTEDENYVPPEIR